MVIDSQCRNYPNKEKEISQVLGKAFRP